MTVLSASNLDPSQSGLKPGHSTDTAFVTQMDLLCIDKGSIGTLILLDLSGEFESSNHPILLYLAYTYSTRVILSMPLLTQGEVDGVC